MIRHLSVVIGHSLHARLRAWNSRRAITFVVSLATFAASAQAFAIPATRPFHATENEPVADANVRVKAPPPPAPKSVYDDQPIRHAPAGAAAVATSPSANPAANVKPPTMELPRVAGALVIVIGLILLLRWGGRKLTRQPAIGRLHRAVQVLGRAPVSPRQSVLLLRVGGRVLVVGDSGTQMNTLCEIANPDEVATILGQLKDDRSDLPSKAFGTLFRRAEHEMSVAHGDGDDASPAHRPTTDDQDMPDPAEAETARMDRALAGTHDELSGLTQRLRRMSDHFRNDQDDLEREPA